jgi:hypothetical protein
MNSISAIEASASASYFKAALLGLSIPNICAVFEIVV